jgi:hypothetical protein
MDNNKNETAVAETKAKKVALTMEFGTLYCTVKGNEIMRPVKAELALYERAGQIYQVKKSFAITNEGYNLLNKVAGISIVTPQKVTADEREHPNPYIERHPTTKMIESVFIRKIGIGYNLAGNVVVVDKTLLYNIYAYFIESIQSKMKKVVWKNGKSTNEKLHPACAQIGTKDEKPEKKKGRWAFFPTVPPLGLWINYEDSAIIDCLNEHTQKQRFGDRIASTIVERNIMKSHPAIGVSKVEPQKRLTTNDHKAYVTVYGFRHELGPVQIDEILAQAERGSKVLDVKAEVIERVDEVDEALAIQDVEEEEKTTGKKSKKEGKKEEAPAKEEGKSPAELKEPPESYYEKDKEKKEEAEK